MRVEWNFVVLWSSNFERSDFVYFSPDQRRNGGYFWPDDHLQYFFIDYVLDLVACAMVGFVFAHVVDAEDSSFEICVFGGIFSEVHGFFRGSVVNFGRLEDGSWGLYFLVGEYWWTWVWSCFSNFRKGLSTVKDTPFWYFPLTFIQSRSPYFCRLFKSIWWLPLQRFNLNQISILIDQDKIFLELGYVQGAILESIPFVHLDQPQAPSYCLLAEYHHQDRAVPFCYIHSGPDFLPLG